MPRFSPLLGRIRKGGAWVYGLTYSAADSLSPVEARHFVDDRAFLTSQSGPAMCLWVTWRFIDDRVPLPCVAVQLLRSVLCELPGTRPECLSSVLPLPVLPY